jgi:hypothetical protein
VFVQSLITRQKAVDDLETKHAAISHLVKTVCDRVYDLREKIEEGTEAAAAAATAAANGSSSDSDLASIKAAAMAELGEGAWSYAEIVDAYLVLLKDMATYATNYFSEALAGQLWNALMMNPPSWDHLDQALVRQQLGHCRTVGARAACAAQRAAVFTHSSTECACRGTATAACLCAAQLHSRNSRMWTRCAY